MYEELQPLQPSEISNTIAIPVALGSKPTLSVSVETTLVIYQLTFALSLSIDWVSFDSVNDMVIC